MDPKRSSTLFPTSGAVLDPYTDLNCDDLRDMLQSLLDKQSRGEHLEFEEVLERDRLQRTLDERGC
jgi:hypothetical protein